jgi:hypothetical protein
MGAYQFKQFVKDTFLLSFGKGRSPRLKEKAIGSLSESADKQQRFNRFTHQNSMPEHAYSIQGVLTKSKSICYTARNM